MIIYKILLKITYIKNFIIRILLKIYFSYKNQLIFLNPKNYINDKSNKNIKKPIFLLGTASGGLTIVSRIIRRHPNIISASGNSLYFYGQDEINQYYKRFIPRKLNIFRFQNFTPQYNAFYSLNKFLKHSVIKKKKFKSYSSKYVMLLNAILKVFSKSGEDKYYVEDGIIEFKENTLSVLTSSIFSLDKIDKNYISQSLSETEKLLGKDDLDDQSRFLISQKIDVLKSINSN